METQTGKKFAILDLGKFEGLDQFVFEAPEVKIKREGKVFLKDLLNLSGAEISINKLPAYESIPFYHTHRQNEEIYIFLSGTGEFQIDGEIFPVGEGSIVRVDPAGERCWRNCGETDLYCVVIQVKAGSYQDRTIQDGMAVRKRVTWS
ncbi:MAG: cupin domain-containing protein [Plectolyngbya sp. WJT66-NPBG17]|jgi:mannose-6-phosphate isomerase-like protein (cupin superfamily)|nr:cupin domain-containing protein [Plectolyngbya sp. WJT66-NPBG17]MBW4527148.1 cupin domain-containing protein [Phormidium tanganyikae FI6-MK23]